MAVVPLLANDNSIGVLVVMDTRIRRFTDDEVSVLTAFADQASLTLEKRGFWKRRSGSENARLRSRISPKRCPPPSTRA